MPRRAGRPIRCGKKGLSWAEELGVDAGKCQTRCVGRNVSIPCVSVEQIRRPSNPLSIEAVQGEAFPFLRPPSFLGFRQGVQAQRFSFRLFSSEASRALFHWEDAGRNRNKPRLTKKSAGRLR